MKTSIRKTVLFRMAKEFILEILQESASVRLRNCIERTSAVTVLRLVESARIEAQIAGLQYSKLDSPQEWFKYIESIEQDIWKELKAGFPINFGKKTLAEFFALLHTPIIYERVEETGIFDEQF